MKNKAYIIAEAEINHNGNINTAIDMIKSAKKCGADCIKFQYIIADELADPSSKFYQLFKECEFSKKDFKKLKSISEDEYNIDFMITVPSVNSFWLSRELNIKKIKIGSSNLTNLILLQEIAKEKDKIEIYLSTGMGDLIEIEQALKNLNYNYGDNKYYMFHCTANYPTEYNNLNLNAIITMKKIYDKIPIGYSDHTTDNIAAIIARSLGATIFEKHFTLDNKMNGPDHFFSTNPENFKNYIDSIRTVEIALGEEQIKPADSEIEMKRKTKRFLVANRDIKKGVKFKNDMFFTKRVGDVESPIAVNEFNIILNLKSPKDYKRGDILQWEDFNK